MSKTIDDGGSAFPCPVGHIECAHPKGMTLRDWFAGQALMGLLANAHICDGLKNKEIADVAVNLSDAMIAARKGSQ